MIIVTQLMKTTAPFHTRTSNTNIYKTPTKEGPGEATKLIQYSAYTGNLLLFVVRIFSSHGNVCCLRDLKWRCRCRHKKAVVSGLQRTFEGFPVMLGYCGLDML